MPEKNTRKTPENFVKIMNTLFPKVGSFLNGETDFQFLVAIMLSAQMTDAGVNKATEKFFQKMRTPKDALEMGEKEIYNFIKSINFAPTKAKNIFKTAQYLQENFSGKIPQKREELTKLFGVGNKTAGVFVVQRGYEYAFPVDTHIARVAIAFGFTQQTNKLKADEIEQDLRQVFPQEIWNMLHLQMILYGRNFLPARKNPYTKDEAWGELFKKISP
jgi:endonuclease-3